MAAKATIRSTREISQRANSLSAALLADVALGKKMLCVLNAQTEALLVNDARSVGMMERQARGLIQQQETNDSVRIAAISALAKAVGASSQTQAGGDSLPKLVDLALLLPLPDAKQLLSARAAILRNHDHLRRANERNRVLLETVLDYVETSLQAFRECAFRPARYGTNQNNLTSATVYLNQTA